MELGKLRSERKFAAQFLAASVAGFVSDAGLLHFALFFGASPKWARVISLLCAMQVAFAINAFLLRKQIQDQAWPALWAPYMAAQGVGAICNYGAYLFLVSSGWPFVSIHLTALTVGAVIGWMMNYAGARFVIFGHKTSGA